MADETQTPSDLSTVLIADELELSDVVRQQIDLTHPSLSGVVVDINLYFREQDELVRLRKALQETAYELGISRQTVADGAAMIAQFKATTKDRIILTDTEAEAWPRFLRVIEDAKRQYLSVNETEQLTALIAHIEKSVILPTAKS